MRGLGGGGGNVFVSNQKRGYFSNVYGVTETIVLCEFIISFLMSKWKSSYSSLIVHQSYLHNYTLTCAFKPHFKHETRN